MYMKGLNGKYFKIASLFFKVYDLYKNEKGLRSALRTLSVSSDESYPL